MTRIVSNNQGIIAAQNIIRGMIVDVNNRKNVEQVNENNEYRYINISLRDFK